MVHNLSNFCYFGLKEILDDMKSVPLFPAHTHMLACTHIVTELQEYAPFALLTAGICSICSAYSAITIHSTIIHKKIVLSAHCVKDLPGLDINMIQYYTVLTYINSYITRVEKYTIRSKGSTLTGLKHPSQQSPLHSLACAS